MRVEATAVIAAMLVAMSARAEEPNSAQMPEIRHMLRWGTELYLMSELLEIRPNASDTPVVYDLIGWYGGAYNRIWAKAEGSQGTRTGGGSTELLLMFGRLIAPFWDAQIGLGSDIDYGNRSGKARALLAFGVQGIAPGWFDVEARAFVSHRGDVSARLEGSYDMLLTQRLVLQPRLETVAAIQSVPEFGIGSGINDVELGLRLRYEFIREVAPYVGVSWQRLLMDTANLARAEGRQTSEVSFVGGLRVWY